MGAWKQQAPQPNTPYKRNVGSVALSMFKRDAELLDILAEYLGTSRSEAARTAIRAMVAQLGILKDTKQK